MLLAAAAAAIDGRMDESTAIYSVDRQETKRNTSTPSGSNNGYYSQHYSSAEIPNNHIKQKPVKSSSHATYYQKDDHRYISKSSIKTRHHPHDQHSSDMDPSNGISGRYYTNNNDELKQNPRIKRNAMHAYITYMIYTDIAQRDRMKPTEKIINPSSNGQANYGDEQNTITNGYDRTRKNEMNGRFEYINNNVHSADDHYHQQQRQQHNNNNSQRPQHHHRHSIGSEPSSLWYTPTSTSLPTHTSSSNSAPFPTTSSSSPHYHLPSSSPSTPQPPSTSNNNNSTSHPIETTRSSPSPISFNSSSGNNNNPLMMGRPLTAFLRDAPSSEQQHHHHHHHHSKDNNHSTNNNSTSRRPHPFSTFSSTSHGSSTSNHKGRHPLL
ncbi:hypothetical protein BDA99DRAFT_186365 [Phascolomyces articulosus]|uniref:Uncharacterized protein n=1 Tax=Phascolomyces articulosus TaxID=60185 RepID=A0AAD5P9Y0_9FUNG|nr:hypothetical protein BDA99DRAFT_186365 [Phascolomyces articulosus]